MKIDRGQGKGMNLLGERTISAKGLSVFIAILVLFLLSGGWVAAKEPRESRSISLAVADNGPDSAVNSEKILKVVSDPTLDSGLYQTLGAPISARPTLNFKPWVYEVDDADYDRLLIVSKHYVTLQYREGARLPELVERLKADIRFSFVGVNNPGQFSVAPTDKFFAYPSFAPVNPLLNTYQWSNQTWITGMPAAWDLNNGWAALGLIDGGVDTASQNGSSDSNDPNWVAVHEDLKGIFAPNHSFNFDAHRSRVGGNIYKEHGSHVAGIMAARTNNSGSTPDSVGGSGVCWGCTIQYAESGVQGQDATDAAVWLTNQGAQVINLSGGRDKFFEDNDGNPATTYSGIPCGTLTDNADDPFCHALEYMRLREVVFVAAAGNNIQSRIQFPASDSRAIGVGGIDSRKVIWDDSEPGSPWPVDSFDYNDGGTYSKCPDPAKYGLFVQKQECGSNYSTNTDKEMDFVAPARKILSSIPVGTNTLPAYPDMYFADQNFNLNNDGFSFATGTSMASPVVAGIAGLLRSSNPLISRNDVYDALKADASNNGFYNGALGTNKMAWGVPDAGKAISKVNGKIGGTVVTNRVTPMFVMYNEDDVDRLYTTRPQVARGAANGNYLGTPDLDGVPDPVQDSTYNTWMIGPGGSGEASPISGYDYFVGLKPKGPSVGHQFLPFASFWVFTSDNSLWKEHPEIFRPLHRMSFRSYCDLRSHTYVISQMEIDMYAGQEECFGGWPNYAATYQYDGIEGYILSECPPDFSCSNANDPSEPQKLYRLYNPSIGESALILHSQLALPSFAGYAWALPHTENLPWPHTSLIEIGYVFPNVDTDGDSIIDGYERLYGLNRFSPDSDCDGLTDGAEFPLDGVQLSGHDPRSGVCP